MTKLVSYQSQEKYAVISIDNGKANAISHEVIEQLNLCLDKAEKEQKVVVLTGKAGMFSAGYDLSVMKQSMEAAMELVEKGSTLSRRLFYPFQLLLLLPARVMLWQKVPFYSCLLTIESAWKVSLK